MTERSHTPIDRPRSISFSSNHNNGNGNHQRRDRSNSHSSHSSQRRDRSNSHSSHSSHHRYGRDRSNSYSSHNHNRKPQSKSSLWKGSINKDIGNDIIVQIVGMESFNHTVYARVDPNCAATPESLATVPIGKVIEIMVDEGWRHVAKDILEKGVHVETANSYPSAAELLELGAVWLLNETAYAAGDHAHARRLSGKDEKDTPDWKDMTLRVHYVPDRFFVAHEVDWTKYCKGLLLDGCTSAIIGGKKAHVPMTGLPDEKDGVIVYEDNDLGFTVLNKPGGMPCHSTQSNHKEDVASMFSAGLKQRSSSTDESKHATFLSLPLRVEPEMHGLVLAATKKEFCSFMTKQLESSNNNGTNNNVEVTKTYRCLVCIKDPDDIDRIEKLINRTIEHYVDVRSPTPKKFVRNKPKSSNHEWQQCLMKITSIGTQSKNFRAACVSSKYSDSNDFTLAHRLWGPDKNHPAEDVGVQYVMQLDVQLMTKSPHQIRGQLAALGVPIVGDGPYGGGFCEMRRHRHLWTRMAVQICHLEFTLPKCEENEEKKRVLVLSEEEEEKKKCVFHLNTAWWSDYLMDYEQYSLASAMSSASVE